MRRTLPALGLIVALVMAGCSSVPDKGGVTSAPAVSEGPTEVATTPPVEIDYFAQTEPTEPCIAAYKNVLTMQAAASDNDFDRAGRIAAFDCASPDDWAATIYRNPVILGNDSLDDEYIYWALLAVCLSYDMHDASVCVQAVEQELMPQPPSWPTA